MTGTQSFVKDAAVNLIYVADYARIDQREGDKQDTSGPARMALVGTDVGLIAENVYLFCASEGLATVIRDSMDREPLAKEMKLRPEQKIILSQSVGYLKK